MPGHFIGKTKANYDFATPMWPDNNVNGNWTKVQYMGPNSEIRTGLTSWGVTDMMYGYAYDARPRQWSAFPLSAVSCIRMPAV